MKITNADLRGIDIALSQLRKKETTVRFSFRLAHIAKVLKPSIEALGEEEQRLVAEARELLKESGVPLPEGPDDRLPDLTPKQKELQNKVQKELTSKLEELFDTEVDVEPFPRLLTVEEFEEAKISPTGEQVMMLGPLVDLEPRSDIIDQEARV